MTLINRSLQILNLVGVIALAGLSVAQWQANSRAVSTADRLDRVRQSQAAKLDEQTKTLQSDATQLDDLHQRLSVSDAALKATDAKLAAATAEHDQLVTERDQLRATLNQWQAALQQRDAAIRTASDQIEKLARQRDEAIRKSNELAAETTRGNGTGSQTSTR